MVNTRVEELCTTGAGEKKHDQTALHELPEEHWRQHWCLDSTYLGVMRYEHNSSGPTRSSTCHPVAFLWVFHCPGPALSWGRASWEAVNVPSPEVFKAGLDRWSMEGIPVHGRGRSWMILKVPSSTHHSVILQSELDQGSLFSLQHVLEVTGKLYWLKNKLVAQN